jgi:hypothetical protein
LEDCWSPRSGRSVGVRGEECGRSVKCQESRKSSRVQGVGVAYRSPGSGKIVQKCREREEYTKVQGVGGL